MKKEIIKKIIAREGLVIFASILLAGIPYITYSFLTKYNDEGVYIGWIFAMYIIIRFSVWAIKTLKEK